MELPGRAPNQYPTITRVYDVAERGLPGACTPTPTLLAANIGIPGTHALDGQLLDVDNQDVQLDPSRPVELSWSVVEPGPVDVFVIALQELVDAGGATAGLQRWGASVAGKTHVTVEPELLEPGHTYIVAITASTGRPGIATGDYLAYQFPMAVSTVYSTTFTVAHR